ncbi:hypothetical protein ACLOJK_023109 [Asimina triloba]
MQSFAQFRDNLTFSLEEVEGPDDLDIPIGLGLDLVTLGECVNVELGEQRLHDILIEITRSRAEQEANVAKIHAIEVRMEEQSAELANLGEGSLGCRNEELRQLKESVEWILANVLVGLKDIQDALPLIHEESFDSFRGLAP